MYQRICGISIHLVTISLKFQGLKETVHPYTFVARTGFKELLEVPGCSAKVVPLLPKLAVAIRGALVSCFYVPDNILVFFCCLF